MHSEESNLIRIDLVSRPIGPSSQVTCYPCCCDSLQSTTCVHKIHQYTSKWCKHLEISWNQWHYSPLSQQPSTMEGPMSFLRQIFPTQPNKKHAIAMLLILKLLQPRNRAICLGQPSNCTLKKNRHKRHVENNFYTSFVTNPCDSFFQPCLALTVSRIPSPNFCCEASGSCQCLMSDSMKNVHTLP